MTRVLSELLEAREPAFGLSLRQLERASGASSTDIRLTSEINQHTKSKLKQLGLDPHDTTGPELYRMLAHRLKQDEAALLEAIKGASPELDNPIGSLAKLLEQTLVPKHCFALKGSVARKLLKVHAPKKAMKALGYRSLDSMLKHESVAGLFAAVWLSESEQWLKKFLAAYAKLTSADFEVRTLTIEHVDSKRWQHLAESAVAMRRHHVFGFKELGSIVLLPLPEHRPAFATLASALLTLHAVNDIRAASTFLKLNQVRSQFGSLVREVVTGEPTISAQLLDRSVPWHIVQRYYARFKGDDAAEIFEPHVQLEDLAWQAVEHALADIAPALEFWRDTAHLALLHNGRPMPLNLTDAVLSHSNGLPYESRIVHNFQRSLTHELMLRYMNHERLEQTVLQQLEAELVTQPALM